MDERAGGAAIALSPHGKQSLVGESEKFCVIGCEAKFFQRSKSFETPPGTPAFTAIGIDENAPFQEALRPWIVVSIGWKYNPHPGARREALLNQATRPE
jgi:hypothetical protein